MKSVGVVVVGFGLVANAEGVSEKTFTVPEYPIIKNRVTLKTKNRTREVVSITLPDENVADMTNDPFSFGLVSSSTVEVEVVDGEKRKNLKLDAAKEDFSIHFPDGSTWYSNHGKPYTEIKENKL